MSVRNELSGKCRERGVTTVEGAIILIAFFMLVFGVMELGWFMTTRQALTNAAREGARFAVVPAAGTNTLPDQDVVIEKVDAYLAAAHIKDATTVVRCPPEVGETCTHDAAMLVVTGSVSTAYTEVTVSKPYTVVTVPGFFKALEITLTGKAIMRRETSE